MLYGILALAWGASLTAAQIDTPPRTGTASNVTISDMSPMIVYTPSSSGPAESTWNQTWAGISWANYTPKYPVIEDDNDTMPLSFHTTSFVGATAQLSFLGTAVYFYGYAHGAFEIEVGGTTTAVEIQSDEVVLLAYSEGLDNAMHDTRLILTSGEISLSAVVVTVEVGGVGATFTNNTYYPFTETATQYLRSSNITWSEGEEDMWYMTTNIGGYLAPEHSYSWITPRVETQVPGAYFTIHPPANTSFISLKTISTNQEGPYTVTVDPPPYDSPVSSSYTQANPWLSMANVVMFFTALDPREMYTIKVQFTGTADQALNFVGGRVLTTTGGDKNDPIDASTGAANGTDSSVDGAGSSASSKKSTPIGAIAGGVVGGVVVLVGLGLLIFFCCRPAPKGEDGQRIQKAGRHKSGGGFFGRGNGPSFEVDKESLTSYLEARVTPLTPPANLPEPSPVHLSENYGAQKLALKHVPAGQVPGAFSPLSGPTSGSASGSVSSHTPQTPATATGAMFLTAQSTQSPRSDDSKGGWGSEAVSPMLSQGTRMTFGQMQPPRPLPTASTGTTYVQVSEALDAGRVVAREEVPPRYNPAWADEDTPHAL